MLTIDMHIRKIIPILSDTSMLSTLWSVQLPGGQDVEVKVESSDSSDTN